MTGTGRSSPTSRRKVTYREWIRSKREAFAIIVVSMIALAGIGLALAFTAPRPPVSTICTINAEGTLRITIVNSTSDSPIGSVPIQVSYLAPTCPPNPYTTSNLGTFRTNASGIIIVGGEVGEYYLQVDYRGTYSFNASTGPGEVTCLFLYLPSGQSRETHSGFL